MIEKKVEYIRSGKPATYVDIIVIAAVLVLSILLIVFSFRNDDKARVSIQVGDKVKSYSLYEDRTVDLTNLLIVVSDGKVWVSQSDCNGNDCVHMGKISRVNQMIVCIPNGVVIKIVGEGELNAETGRV